jgi:hypothetical protein
MSRIVHEKQSALVAKNAHPEAYPPTLNALAQLSEQFDSIFLLFRPLMPVLWNYPAI